MKKIKRTVKSPPYKKGRPILVSYTNMGEENEQERASQSSELQPVTEETKIDLKKEVPETSEKYVEEVLKSEAERFIEISKYFSNPLRKTASYLSENSLVSYPSTFRIEYKRGGVLTEHFKFCNLVLEPVFVKLYKIIPDLEQIKFINLSFSRSKRIPPGLSYNLGFVYDDVNEKPAQNAKMIFVASRKTTTPCYQICEIELDIQPQKIHRPPA